MQAIVFCYICDDGTNVQLVQRLVDLPCLAVAADGAILGGRLHDTCRSNKFNQNNFDMECALMDNNLLENVCRERGTGTIFKNKQHDTWMRNSVCIAQM